MTSAAIRNALRQEWKQHHRAKWIREGFRLAREGAVMATLSLAEKIDCEQRSNAEVRAGRSPSPAVRKLYQLADEIRCMHPPREHAEQASLPAKPAGDGGGVRSPAPDARPEVGYASASVNDGPVGCPLNKEPSNPANPAPLSDQEKSA
ncbi:MAG: hypothetical protein JWQ03_3089 [Variovorax sp.]|nr:hypothetical protein [Variovorax sp.]